MSNILIAYFSHRGENYVAGSIVDLPVGNTERVAEMIARHTGGDLFRIERVAPYPAAYKACVDEAVREMRAQARPELTGRVADMAAYDTVFVGYPNWCGTMPMAVCTFLEAYDFAGKRLVPFCTHEGSGLANSTADLARLCPSAQILPGLAVRGSRAAGAEEEVAAWLRTLQLAK